eukprot:SAG31_NODE_5694_length_2376_cov_1.946860_2_plen_336_part_00
MAVYQEPAWESSTTVFDTQGLHRWHWETNPTASVVDESATKELLLTRIANLRPSGWRTVQAGDSEGWVNRAKATTDILNYARRHNERFTAEAVTELEAYFARVPASEAAFTASVPSLTVVPLARFVQYCQGVRAVRAEHAQQVESAVAEMMVHGENTVPNVRHSGFTAAQRRAALQEVASSAEYSTTEPVNVGEYVFASVQEDNPDYRLPLSFGLVHRIVDTEGEDIGESTQDDDILTIGWFAPVAQGDQQKYGPGKWELIKNTLEGSQTLDFRSDIERGSVVLAGIQEAKLTAKTYYPGNRVLISCKFGMALLRKLKELPTSVTRWDLYGVPRV